MNRFSILAFSIFIATFVYSSLSVGDPVKIPVELQNFIERFNTHAEKLQGGAVAILHKDQVIYKKTFGNQEGERPITSNTLFPLASLSKPLSAIAIALMVEKGRLNFDETFKLPYLKNAVNLANILSQTTGYQFSGNTQIEQGATRQTLLNAIKAQRPICKPGECYYYSNAIFSLLEEALNQKKLSLNVVIKNLRSSLKTQGIQILPLSSDSEIAYPHAKKVTHGSTIIKSLSFPSYYSKITPASAGIFASIDGMIEVFKLSFGYRPDLISKETLDRLYQPIKLNQDIFKWGLKWPINETQIVSFYGLGWRILKIKNHPEYKLIFHSGYISGISTFIGFIPSKEMGIIILVNQDSHFADEKGIEFWSNFLSRKKTEKPEKP